MATNTSMIRTSIHNDIIGSVSSIWLVLSLVRIDETNFKFWVPRFIFLTHFFRKKTQLYSKIHINYHSQSSTCYLERYIQHGLQTQYAAQYQSGNNKLFVWYRRQYLFSCKVTTIYCLIRQHSRIQRFIVHIHISSQMRWTISAHLTHAFFFIYVLNWKWEVCK